MTGDIRITLDVADNFFFIDIVHVNKVENCSPILELGFFKSVSVFSANSKLYLVVYSALIAYNE